MSGSLTRGGAVGLGLVVVACLAVGGWALTRLGEREGLFRDTFEIRIGFAQVHDVDKGTPVRIRGLDVGQVVAVEYPDEDPMDGQTKVWLRLRIDSKFQSRLYADAQATIHSKGLLSSNVIAIHPGSPMSGLLMGDEIAAVEPVDMTKAAAKLYAVAERAEAVMVDIQTSQGTIAKLLKDDALYHDIRELTSDTAKAVRKADSAIAALKDELASVKSFIQTSEDTVRSVQQDAEAIKKLPLVRSYVEDSVSLLVRPDCDRERQTYNALDLFEPGTSVLTPTGRQHLIQTAVWLNGNRDKNSEVVVVTYLDASTEGLSPAACKTLTQKQSDMVVEFLREQGVHKLGVWSRRKVTGLGMGTALPPVVEKAVLPLSRTEIVLFTVRQ